MCRVHIQGTSYSQLRYVAAIQEGGKNNISNKFHLKICYNNDKKCVCQSSQSIKTSGSEIEISKILGKETSTAPVVIGALVLVRKGLEKYAHHIPGDIKADRLQNIAILGSAHVLRKTFSIKRKPLLP